MSGTISDRKSPMANASAPADEGFIAADFDHAASGVHYRITKDAGHVWLSYERNDFARMLDGRQELRYFLRSDSLRRILIMLRPESITGSRKTPAMCG